MQLALTLVRRSRNRFHSESLTVTALDHEIVDHTMEFRSLVAREFARIRRHGQVLLGQLFEVSHRFRHCGKEVR